MRASSAKSDLAGPGTPPSVAFSVNFRQIPSSPASTPARPPFIALRGSSLSLPALPAPAAPLLLRVPFPAHSPSPPPPDSVGGETRTTGSHLMTQRREANAVLHRILPRSRCHLQRGATRQSGTEFASTDWPDAPHMTRAARPCLAPSRPGHELAIGAPCARLWTLPERRLGSNRTRLSRSKGYRPAPPPLYQSCSAVYPRPNVLCLRILSYRCFNSNKTRGHTLSLPCPRRGIISSHDHQGSSREPTSTLRTAPSV
ncbi:hypothetical protein BD414DRAFT_179159 [Trametes punicea]|nr:hypothetical protein BD414DRAFT_179159 [Trametes punicea]